MSAGGKFWRREPVERGRGFQPLATGPPPAAHRALHWQLWWAVAPLAVLALVALAIVADQIAGATLRRQAQATLAATRGTGAAAAASFLQQIEATVRRIAAEPRTADALAALGGAARQADEDPRAAPETLAAARQALQARLVPYAGAAPAGSPLDAAALVAAPRGAAWLQTQYVDAGDQPPAAGDYAAAHAAWHAGFAGLAQAAGVDDLLLVRAADGRVVYSVAKRPDFQTDLIDGPYANSHLGALFRRVSAAGGGGVQFADFAPYVAARGRPTAFAAAPVGAGGALVGVVVAVFDGDRITRAVTAGGRFAALGLGASGDLYLIGSDDRLRSESRFLDRLAGLDPRVQARGSAIATYTAPALGALGTRVSDTGSGGITYLHPRSGAMLASIGPVETGGLDWRVVAEIREGEALQRGPALRRRLGLAAIGISFAVVLGLAGVTLWTALPLRRLHHDLGGLRAGDPAARLPVIGRGEAAALAQRVNGLLGRLHGDAASERRRREGELRGLESVVEGLRRGDLTQRAYASGDLTGLAAALNAMSDRLADLEAGPPPVAPQRMAAAADALHAAAEHLRGEAAGHLDALGAAADAVGQLVARGGRAAEQVRSGVAAGRAAGQAGRSAAATLQHLAHEAEGLDAALAAAAARQQAGAEQVPLAGAALAAAARVSTELNVLALNAALSETRGGAPDGFAAEAQRAAEGAAALCTALADVAARLQATLAAPAAAPADAAAAVIAAARAAGDRLVQALASHDEQVEGLAALAAVDGIDRTPLAAALERARRIGHAAEAVAREAAALRAEAAGGTNRPAQGDDAAAAAPAPAGGGPADDLDDAPAQPAEAGLRR